MRVADEMTTMKEPTPSLRSYRGLVLTHEAGFFGAIPRLLTYSPEKTWTLLAPLLVRDLTVYNSVLNVIPHLAALFYALLLMTILAFTAFPDGEMGQGKACDAGNVQICQLEETMKNAKSEFRFLVAFVLAGFVATTVGTWNARRTTYASLCGNVRNLIVQLATFIPVDKSNEALCKTRRRIGRWVILAFELAMQKARGSMDSEATCEYLCKQGLALPTEWDAMVKGDRHTTVIAWIQQKCVMLEKEGLIPAQALPKISEDISTLRGKANDIMGCLEMDKPYAYSSLVGMLVNINLFIMCTWKGVEWSIWCRSFGGALFEQPKWYLDILVLVVWNMSYRALYDLTTTLHSPFGARPLDVFHELIAKALRKLADEMMEGASTAPEED
ncbi:bglB [Symbiodinium natans]|uniref:BglB protein n=1 Tax=Symbiodinium natans TaxID=878477 RepID=A0A812QXT4_9DINO|nr:bglB [Symbiodinium natans]